MILPSVNGLKKHIQLQRGAAGFYIDLRQNKLKKKIAAKQTSSLLYNKDICYFIISNLTAGFCVCMCIMSQCF